MAWWNVLQLTGLALCVLGVAIIFLFGYPPKEETRQAVFVRLSRLALLLVFCGFLLQLAAAVASGVQVGIHGRADRIHANVHRCWMSSEKLPASPAFGAGLAGALAMM